MQAPIDCLCGSQHEQHEQREQSLVDTGPSEGVFGWVAANYASGALQGYALRQGLRLRKPAVPSAPFVGVFELGGASAQVCRSRTTSRKPFWFKKHFPGLPL